MTPAGATGGVGTLDFAYDVAGDVFTNEFYVLGSSEAATAFPGDIDNASYGDNMFENSSATIYLVNVPDPIKRQDIIQTWAGTDISDPVGSLTTRIATDPAVELLDAVAFWDGDAGDVFYDGAPEFGPDGTFLPSGHPPRRRLPRRVVHGRVRQLLDERQRRTRRTPTRRRTPSTRRRAARRRPPRAPAAAAAASARRTARRTTTARGASSALGASGTPARQPRTT